MKISASIFFILFFILSQNILTTQEIEKKYYNNVFAGGKERLFSIKNGIDNIYIKKAYYDIYLYENYSEIKIKYFLENKGEDAEFYWAYPLLEAKIEKVFENTGNNSSRKYENEVIKVNYIDYKIFVNDIEKNYELQEGKEIEIGYPYKIGDSYVSFKDKKRDIIFEEAVNSYFYTYSWNVTPFQMKKDEKLSIKISYKTPHFYNTITVKNNDGPPLGHLYEDPALKYYSLKRKKIEKNTSEKVFSYSLNTVYSNKEKIIRRTYIKVTANIIDQKYLKVMPTNYKKKGKRYYWKYKKLKAKPLHNIQIKISPIYSSKGINPLCFDTNIKRKKDGFDEYYEINKKKDSIIMTYHDYNEKDKIEFSKIKIAPENFYNDGKILSAINKPLKFEIYFSDDPDFQTSKKYITEISLKKFLKYARKRFYVMIFNEDDIECKYIKIKVLETSNDNDIVKISDIQFLK